MIGEILELLPYSISLKIVNLKEKGKCCKFALSGIRSYTPDFRLWWNRKIPRDLTEASLSGAGLSIIAALSMMFLFGMELSNYLTVSTSTSIIVDKSSDGDFLRIDFNISPENLLSFGIGRFTYVGMHW
ncbi:hypothetical protein SLEP1_g26461 [Rubroshorea leprosula]|uniref:Endoplasmic reticulum vesicle transporter N-terminal domain-containing protein n=1 Tax=Rubroshorea leprosula TaxID=152421 RepID=A0AAV5JSK4_9ROSI|nr:hypothetical protein SLEP1_g26461 [Rubroshorea leprosula]